MKIVKFLSRDRLQGLFCSLIPRASPLFGGYGTRKKTLQPGMERNFSSPLASAFFFFRGFANRNGELVCRRYIFFGIRPFIRYSASQFILGILRKSPSRPFAAAFAC